MARMDPCYFLGRAEILGWINETLSTHVAKVEDTCTGAIACQLIDSIHPGVVSMKRVDFNTKLDHEYIQNYKVLQDALSKLGVDKYIDVQMLCRGKVIDNLEFMQWMKSYFDGHTGGIGVPDYDGPGRRAISKTGDIKGGRSTSSHAKAPIKARPSSAAVHHADAAPSSRPIPVPVAAAAKSVRASLDTNKQVAAAAAAAEVAEWKAKAEGFEREKDFYYAKLRDIEMLCATPLLQAVPAIKHVEAILYAATAEEGEAVVALLQKESLGDDLVQPSDLST